MAFTLPYYMNYILKSQRQLTSEGPDLYRIVTVQTLLKTIHLLCITVSVGRSRSVKNAADTKLKQVPAFFKAHLNSNAQKAPQESGGTEL